jgi:hypothetical protein
MSRQNLRIVENYLNGNLLLIARIGVGQLSDQYAVISEVCSGFEVDSEADIEGGIEQLAKLVDTHASHGWIDRGLTTSKRAGSSGHTVGFAPAPSSSPGSWLGLAERLGLRVPEGVTARSGTLRFPSLGSALADAAFGIALFSCALSSRSFSRAGICRRGAINPSANFTCTRFLVLLYRYGFMTCRPRRLAAHTTPMSRSWLASAHVVAWRLPRAR